MALSFGFFAMVIATGVQTTSRWKTLPKTTFRNTIAVIDITLIALLIFLNSQAPLMQLSSMHNQRIAISITLLINLSLVALFIAQEIVRQRKQEQLSRI